MSSTNFTFDDVLQAARTELNDDAQRRWVDGDIMGFIVPRVYAQLYSDRPDLFIGTGFTPNFKPSQSDALPFSDEGFNPFVEALVAAIRSEAEESTSGGSAADSRSERTRRT